MNIEAVNMELSEIMKIHEEFEKRNGWHSKPELFSDEFMDRIFRNIVLMTGELGEFANKAKKMRRDGRWTYEDISELREELADLFMYLLKTAITLDMDLEEEYLKKLKKNEKRFERFREK